jgi:threonyl-tRNA synthetase
LTSLTHFSPVVNADYPAIEKVSDLAIKEKQKFERLVVSKETLLEMFAVRLVIITHSTFATANSSYLQYNKYKVHLINSKIPDGTSTTVYRCGPMIDLCVGPHIPHTGKIKAFMVTKVCCDIAYKNDETSRNSSSMNRTHPLTSSATRTTTRYNASMVSLSQTRSS